ncbi:MAG TPA: 6-phosphogluconolactonase [Solirubrobacteraceae bacterium]|nr:6-phosphogluconolactonase [Solirubrobacteraceae bacterium]
MSRAELRVLEDPAAEVARMLGESARAGAHIVLTGGSSPKRAFELAAEAGDDWSGATAWFGDERCVAPDDERSNFSLAQSALLSRLDAPPAVHRMEGERGPHEGADAYQAIVLRELGDTPAWDLLMLGLGPDSHCASLFPNRPEKDVDDRLVVGVPEAGMEPWLPRISLTVPAINAAKRVVFLVTGESKRDAVRRAFVDEDPASPAARVRPAGELLVLLDAAAKP